MALNNVPQAGQTLAVTRDPIRNNFTTINNSFLINHGEYGTVSAGKHTFVTMVDQTGNPLPFLVNEGGFYNFTFPQTATLEMWFRMPATGFSYPITNCILSINGNPGLASNGWQYGPGGTLEKWGTYTAGAAGAINIALNAFGPAFTVVPWNAQITPYLSGNAATSYVTNITAVNLAVQNTGGQFMWRVIGA